MPALNHFSNISVVLLVLSRAIDLAHFSCEWCLRSQTTVTVFWHVIFLFWAGSTHPNSPADASVHYMFHHRHSFECEALSTEINVLALWGNLQSMIIFLSIFNLKIQLLPVSGSQSFKSFYCRRSENFPLPQVFYSIQQINNSFFHQSLRVPYFPVPQVFRPSSKILPCNLK